MNDNKDDLPNLGNLVEEFLDKRIEYRKLSAELNQLRKNIYYLKSKQANQESEEFVLEKGKVIFWLE